MADNFKVDLTEPNFNALLVSLGATGSIYYAPHGSDTPTGLDSYETPYVNLGWLSDEGLSEQIARESQAFTPWQSNSPVRESATSEEFTFSATLWTIGGLANAMRYGVAAEDMTYEEAGKYVEFTQGADLPKDFRFCLSFDVLDGDKHRRFFLPAASVTEPSDVTYQNGDLIGYPMTWRANFDADAGFSILRRFKEGWKPGQAGVDASAGAVKINDLGDWSKRSASAPGVDQSRGGSRAVTPETDQ